MPLSPDAAAVLDAVEALVRSAPVALKRLFPALQDCLYLELLQA
jgi:hypothetical protein